MLHGAPAFFPAENLPTPMPKWIKDGSRESAQRRHFSALQTARLRVRPSVEQPGRFPCGIFPPDPLECALLGIPLDHR